MAHVLGLDTSDVEQWFRDSPYTWGSPKSSNNTMVYIGGEWQPYIVRKRTCVPPMVCSLMPKALSCLAHTEVDFDHPEWVQAMGLCEDFDSPERRVHKVTLVRTPRTSCVSIWRPFLIRVCFLLRDTTQVADACNISFPPVSDFLFFSLARQAFFKTLSKLDGGCSSDGEDHCPCGGHPVLVLASGNRRAFIGYSGWRPGDPPKWNRGHMSASIPHGVDSDQLEQWLAHGCDEASTGETCCFTASKRTKERTCTRHGGELPPLVRAAGGRSDVRVEFHAPVGRAKEAGSKAIVVLRGTHTHVFPVCRASSRFVHSVVQKSSSSSIRALQVRHVIDQLQRFSLSSRGDFFSPCQTRSTSLFSFLWLVGSCTHSNRRRQQRRWCQQCMGPKAAAPGALCRPSVWSEPAGGIGFPSSCWRNAPLRAGRDRQGRLHGSRATERPSSDALGEGAVRRGGHYFWRRRARFGEEWRKRGRYPCFRQACVRLAPLLHRVRFFGLRTSVSLLFSMFLFFLVQWLRRRARNGGGAEGADGR